MIDQLNQLLFLTLSALASSLPNSVEQSPNRVHKSVSAQASPTHQGRHKARINSASNATDDKVTQRPKVSPKLSLLMGFLDILGGNIGKWGFLFPSGKSLASLKMAEIRQMLQNSIAPRRNWSVCCVLCHVQRLWRLLRLKISGRNYWSFKIYQRILFAWCAWNSLLACWAYLGERQSWVHPQTYSFFPSFSLSGPPATQGPSVYAFWAS